MDIRLSSNEFELCRAIVANRLEALTDTGTNPENDAGTRRSAIKHMETVGELLISLDCAEANNNGS